MMTYYYDISRLVSKVLTYGFYTVMMLLISIITFTLAVHLFSTTLVPNLVSMYMDKVEILQKLQDRVFFPSQNMPTILWAIYIAAALTSSLMMYISKSSLERMEIFTAFRDSIIASALNGTSIVVVIMYLMYVLFMISSEFELSMDIIVNNSIISIMLVVTTLVLNILTLFFIISTLRVARYLKEYYRPRRVLRRPTHYESSSTW